MYDFMVFGYYATGIAKTFFPNNSEYASLMQAFATFGAGYLMRPLGAIVLGAYIDHHGRRKGLLLTLALMAAGTVSIGCTPGYQTLGLFAPLLVVAGRLVQGLSAGVEIGGVSVYLAEMATPGHKGFYVSWQSGSQQIAVAFAALLGLSLASWLPPDQMLAWGWRIPLLAGSMLVPFIFLLRSSLLETDDFLARKHRPSTREIWRTLAVNWRLVILGMMISTMTTVTFYLITAYMPTFGSTVLRLSTKESMIVTLCVGLSNFALLPVMGAASDRLGRRPLLITFSLLALVTAYPVLAWLVAFIFQIINCRAVVLDYFRELQRLHGGVLDRDHASRGAGVRLLPRLQPGDRDFRRLHAGGFDVSDPCNGKSRDAGSLAVAGGSDGFDGDVAAYVAAADEANDKNRSSAPLLKIERGAPHPLDNPQAGKGPSIYGCAGFPRTATLA
jgi:MFS family permease